MSLSAVVDLSPLLDIMERLRDPETGCAWDVEQTFKTVAPYTIEEAYEVADACERSDMVALKDELGDLMLQVVFHSQMAKERGAFSIVDVIASICDKMTRRHPHVFGPERSRPDWEAIKADERSVNDDKSALAAIAITLPALLRAEKLQKRAARTGFDWPNEQGPIAKISEEIQEIKDASSRIEKSDEIGDLLFAVVNWARHLDVDPEAALRGANQKFEKRFRLIEAAGADNFTNLSLEEKEKLWVQAKLRD